MKRLIALLALLFLSVQCTYAAFPVPVQTEQKKENMVHRQIEKIRTVVHPKYYGQSNGNGAMATVSLVCGIVGLFFFGIVFGLVAIISGVIGLQNNRPHQGMASWGLALGLIDFIIPLITILKH